MTVLSIDPGRQKCGLAVVVAQGSASPTAVHKEIVETERLVARVLQLRAAHALDRILLGDGTQGSALLRALREALPGTPAVELVPEAFTSQRARERLRSESLPRGIWRLVPAGMRTPSAPYDDTVAVILAEDWFGRQAGKPVAHAEP